MYLYLLFLKAALVAFATFVSVRDDPLTPDRVFVTLSLFNILHFPLLMLQFLKSSNVQARIPLKRLSVSTFLQYDEIDPDNVETREQSASGMYYSDVNINDIIMTSQ